MSKRSVLYAIFRGLAIGAVILAVVFVIVILVSAPWSVPALDCIKGQC